MAGKKPARRRVALRHNRAQRTRDRDWTRKFREGNLEINDHTTAESVRAKGELSRKREINTDIAPGVFDPDDPKSPDRGCWIEGVVVAIRGQIVKVHTEGAERPCTIRQKLKDVLTQRRSTVVVGDRVFVTPGKTPNEGVIEAVGPRHGELFRRYRNKAHTVVANVDRVIIVGSIDEPPLKPALIDRYTVAAEMGEIEPVVCINKLDLDVDGVFERIAEVYEQIGVRILGASATTGQGIDELREALRDRQSVLAGQSGVGKSTLLNALQPGLELATQPVSEETLKGKHTTVAAQLLELDFGGYVVDTPGVRQFLLWECPPQELAGYFVEFEEHLADCKFSDCTHTHEEACTVKAAVTAGRIPPQRYESYLRILDDFSP